MVRLRAPFLRPVEDAVQPPPPPYPLPGVIRQSPPPPPKVPAPTPSEEVTPVATGGRSLSSSAVQAAEQQPAQVFWAAGPWGDMVADNNDVTPAGGAPRTEAAGPINPWEAMVADTTSADAIVSPPKPVPLKMW